MCSYVYVTSFVKVEITHASAVACYYTTSTVHTAPRSAPHAPANGSCCLPTTTQPAGKTACAVGTVTVRRTTAVSKQWPEHRHANKARR